MAISLLFIGVNFRKTFLSFSFLAHEKRALFTFEKQLSPSSVCIVRLRKIRRAWNKLLFIIDFGPSGRRTLFQNSELNCNFSLLCNLKIGYGSLKKVQINLASCSPCTTFAASEGRNPRVKNAFLALSRLTKSPISSWGMRTMQRSFCLYIHTSTAHAVPHKVYTTAWGICFSVHFCYGVWRYQLYNERDKSLRFSCIR